MFKIQIAKYINDNMVRHEMTYKDLSARSGVPITTIHSYAQAKVNGPDEDNLRRIVQAFGDPPEILQKIRRETMDSTAEENRLIAHSDDKERMEAFAALMRTNMLSVMEEYRTASAARQTEIIEHADRRVAEARRAAPELNAKVLAQCEEEIARQKAHHAELIVLREKAAAQAEERSERLASYLRLIIRNLSVALIVVSLLSVVGLSVLGGYAAFAYHTFDRQDPDYRIRQEGSL